MTKAGVMEPESKRSPPAAQVPSFMKSTASQASRVAKKNGSKECKSDIDAAQLFSRADDRGGGFVFSNRQPESPKGTTPGRAKTPPLNTHYALIGQHLGDVQETLDDSWGAHASTNAQLQHYLETCAYAAHERYSHEVIG
jgi:hypothetical protein